MSKTSNTTFEGVDGQGRRLLFVAIPVKVKDSDEFDLADVVTFLEGIITDAEDEADAATTLHGHKPAPYDLSSDITLYDKVQDLVADLRDAGLGDETVDERGARLDDERFGKQDADLRERCVTLSRHQIAAWVGRPLNDEETAYLEELIPDSSIPDAIGTIVNEQPEAFPLPQGLTERGDERYEVDDTAEARRLFACENDPTCVLADMHDGECTSDRHPNDCLYCAAGEPMVHNYEPPQED